VRIKNDTLCQELFDVWNHWPGEAVSHQPRGIVDGGQGSYVRAETLREGLSVDRALALDHHYAGFSVRCQVEDVQSGPCNADDMASGSRDEHLVSNREFFRVHAFIA